MASAAYSFIDIAVLDPIRQRLAMGDSLLVLDSALEEVLWANGPGARLLGFADIATAIGAPAGLSPVTRRQLASLPGFPHVARMQAVTVRLAGGLSGRPTTLQAQGLRLPQGEIAMMLVVPAAHGGARTADDAARDAISGFASDGSFAALVREDATVAAASEGFEDLGIGSDLLATLVEDVRDEEDRLVKRLVEVGNGTVAVGIARLTDAPRLHLLLAIEADAPAEPEASVQEADDGSTEVELGEDEADQPVLELFPRADVSLTASDLEAPDQSEADAAPGGDASEAPRDAGQPAAMRDDEAALPDPDLDVVDAASGLDEETESAASDLPTLVPEHQHAHAADAGPVRFVWRTDAGGRFTTISEEFTAAMGREAADVTGLRFGEAAEKLGIDPEGVIAGLLERRDTWSGRTVMWPMAGTDLKVPVDLAALPIYDRTRQFEGFRGFGVARMADAVIDPHGVGGALREEPSPETTRLPPPANDDPFHGEAPALAIPSGPDRRQADKVVRLAEHRATANTRQTTADALTATERSAFREIGDRLRRESGPNLIVSEGKGEDDEVVENLAPATADTPPTGEAAVPDALGDVGPPEDDGAAEDADAQAEIEGRFEPPDGALDISQAAAESSAEEDIAAELAADADVMMDEDGAEIAIEPEAEEPVGAENEEDEAATAIPAQPAPDEPSPGPVGGTDELVAAEDRPAEPAALKPADDGAPVPALLRLDELAPAAELSEPPSVPSALCGQPAGLDSSPFMQLIGGLPTPIVIHSGERLHHANREFLRLTGYGSLDELQSAGGLGALFAGDAKPGDGNLSLRTSSDETVPVSAHLQSVPWAGGKALLLTLVPVQSSAVADRAAALEARVAELRTIIDTATDGVVLIDTSGAIRSISRPAEALFGLDSDEVEGKPFATLFAIESQRAAAEYLARLSRDDVASVMNDGREVIGREAQGGFIPLFMSIGRLPGDGGFCAVLRDITHWKRAEEDLNRARAQAERSSSQKTEFLARVSHEVRTPLNAIIGFSELMLDEKFGPIGSERYRDYLRDINRSGNHVLDLVNDLLDISKIEAGEQEMSYEAVSLNETLSETVGMMQPQANRERVIIRSSFVSRLPDVVADLRSVRQIALNLLSNAIRATPAGGQVIVSTTYESSGDIVIRVRDTGIGMSAAEIEQALKPFKQINALKRSRGDGTGLGLPLTKALVEANRARFSITSAPAQGTLVEITFPATRVLAE